MKLLVFYPYIPYPLDRGTYQRTFHLLRELAREHTVDLLALDEDGERTAHREVFEKFCRKVRFVPFQHPSWPRLFPDRLLDLTPTSVTHWKQPQVAAALQEMLAGDTYDAIHVCDLVLLQYLEDQCSHIPVVVDRSRVDLEFQWSRYRVMSRGWKGRLLDLECIAKTWLYEKRMARRVAAEVVCGPDDETFIRAHISQTTPVQVIANGVDLEYFDATQVSEERAPQPTIMFCGAMDYTPNVDALRWFFGHDIHDQVRTQVPNLEVLIVGKSPVAEVQAYGSRPGVTVTGGVPDVRPYYRQAWMQIVPLRIGGGTRLKIVESLAIGTPVVSTTIGAQGLALEHGKEILLADTPESFAQETVRALQDAALRQSLEYQGQLTARERFGWPSIGKRLSSFYGQLLTTPPQSHHVSHLPPSLGASHCASRRAV